MTTEPASVRALRLVDQAVGLLDTSDDDPRLSILMATSRAWENAAPHDKWTSILAEFGDPRWSAAAALLKYDEPAAGEKPLRYVAARLLVQITDQTEDLIGALGETSQGLRQEAGELRSALDRLERIVHAITAVHLLEETTA